QTSLVIEAPSPATLFTSPYRFLSLRTLTFFPRTPDVLIAPVRSTARVCGRRMKRSTSGGRGGRGRRPGPRGRPGGAQMLCSRPAGRASSRGLGSIGIRLAVERHAHVIAPRNRPDERRFVFDVSALAPELLHEQLLGHVLGNHGDERVGAVLRNEGDARERAPLRRDCDFRRFAGTPLGLLVTGFVVLAASNKCRMPCSNGSTAFSKAPSCPTRTMATDKFNSNDGGRNTSTVPMNSFLAIKRAGSSPTPNPD